MRSELGPVDSLSNLSARASVIHSERGESEIGPDDSISNVGVGSRLAGGARLLARGALSSWT